MLHCGNILLTDLYKCVLKFKENFPRNGRRINNSYLVNVHKVTVHLFSYAKFVQKIFDTLINYINRVVITFDIISQVFYFYMNNFHTGENYEKPVQNCVD